MAKTGKRVLLIDGDMRKPQLHNCLQVEITPGFGELLAGTASLDQVLRQIAPDFFCLPAGKPLKDSYHSLHHGDLQTLLRDLQQRFAYVLIDSPPLGVTSDAFIISKMTTGLLLVVSLVSPRSLLKMAHHRLQHLNIPLAGLIVNDPQGKTSAAGGYDYYSYGYY